MVNEKEPRYNETLLKRTNLASPLALLFTCIEVPLYTQNNCGLSKVSTGGQLSWAGISGGLSDENEFPLLNSLYKFINYTSKFVALLRKIFYASVSVSFRSKERGTRVKGHSRSIFRAAKTENPVPRRSSVFLCSETTRKRLPRRLLRQKNGNLKSLFSIA